MDEPTTGKQWNQPLLHYAVFEVVADALKRTTNVDDKQVILDAIKATDMRDDPGPHHLVGRRSAEPRAERLPHRARRRQWTRARSTRSTSCSSTRSTPRKRRSTSTIPTNGKVEPIQY